tara:strand:+ start:145 stop:741 length:597 start_codon:yes stop_codon:yes gene_type:complete
MDLEKIKVLDDVIPKWLHQKAVETVPYLPLKWGHRGLGPDQGYQFFSDAWKHEEINNAPWVLQALWMAFEEQKHLIDPDVGDIQLNQIQVNLTTKDHIGGLHVDTQGDTKAYTMVYSVIGDSGMNFYNNDSELKHSVDYADARCIVFPSAMIHEGQPPKETSPRVTVGFIFSGRSSQFARDRGVIMPIFRKEQQDIVK